MSNVVTAFGLARIDRLRKAADSDLKNGVLQSVEVVFIGLQNVDRLGFRDSDTGVYHKLGQHRTVDEYDGRLEA